MGQMFKFPTGEKISGDELSLDYVFEDKRVSHYFIDNLHGPCTDGYLDAYLDSCKPKENVNNLRGIVNEDVIAFPNRVVNIDSPCDLVHHLHGFSEAIIHMVLSYWKREVSEYQVEELYAVRFHCNSFDDERILATRPYVYMRIPIEKTSPVDGSIYRVEMTFDKKKVSRQWGTAWANYLSTFGFNVIVHEGSLGDVGFYLAVGDTRRKEEVPPQVIELIQS